MKRVRTFLVIIAALYMLAVEIIGVIFCVLIEILIGRDNRLYKWFRSEMNGIADIAVTMLQKEKRRISDL